MAIKAWGLTTPADDALKNTVPGLIRDVKEHVQTAAGFYSEAQSTPDKTIAIYAGIVYFGITKVEYAGLAVADLGTGGAFEVSAMTANYFNKILFTIDSSGTLAATKGTEHAVAASVVAPAIPAGKFPVCMVTVQDDGTATAGTIHTIEQSEIQQLQSYAQRIGGDVTAAANLTANTLIVGDDGAKGVKALALGAANLKLFMNAAGTANEYAAGLSIISFSRDMAAASGDVSYTGAGFMPKAAIVIASIHTAANIFSFGMTVGIAEYSVALVPRTVPIWLIQNGLIIYIEADAADGSKLQYAANKSMDVDGMTWTWTKTGLPTSLIQGCILFIR